MSKKNLLSGRDKELQELAEQYEAAKAENKPIYLDADDLADLADWYAMHGKSEQATEVVEYGLRLHPNSTPLLVEQAYLFMDAQKRDKAKQIIGQIPESYSSEVKVLKRDGDWLQIEITGWTESAGRQRVLTQFPGKRIFVASIRGDVQQQVKTLEKTTVADTNTEWSKLQATAWMKKGDMVNDIKPIWAYADSLYNGTCNQCHGAPEISHFDANGWIGTLNGMIGFTSLDKREERTLLKYLQMNASDTAGKAHGDKKEEK